MYNLNVDERARWLKTAEQLKPKLASEWCDPIATVEVLADAQAFQGWKVVPKGDASEVFGEPVGSQASLIFDFGEVMVGHPLFKVRLGEEPADAPLRLRLRLGESIAEVMDASDPFRGDLSQSWMQEELLTLDVLPCDHQLHRRYAFRYLRVDVVNASERYCFSFEGIRCKRVSSAGFPTLDSAVPDRWKAIYKASTRTLVNCMQTVFEDGPKRDRRLWIGDLRLQAIASYATVGGHSLVKRCLYLFAACADEQGIVRADFYEHPAPRMGACYIADYSALFPVILGDYFAASKDLKTAKELWLVALKQLRHVLHWVDDHGLFQEPEETWVFIDWCDALDKQAAMQGLLVYALKEVIRLAKALDCEADIEEIEPKLSLMVAAAKRELLDDRGLWVSGSKQQISYASWAWMTLADVLSPEASQRSYRLMLKQADVVKPGGPYLYHHVVDALFRCGLRAEAETVLETYWGGMLERGATTFWELFDPEDDFLTCYGNHLLNSYCHAWSCTPAYFIKKELTEVPQTRKH